MSIGRLRHKMSLQQQSLTPDGGGGFTASWQEVAEVYADIAALGGTESLDSGQLAAVTPCRITVLYREDITPAMRLALGNKTYDIVSVRDPDGGNAWLEIIARLR